MKYIKVFCWVLLSSVVIVIDTVSSANLKKGVSVTYDAEGNWSLDYDPSNLPSVTTYGSDGCKETIDTFLTHNLKKGVSVAQDVTENWNLDYDPFNLPSVTTYGSHGPKETIDTVPTYNLKKGISVAQDVEGNWSTDPSNLLDVITYGSHGPKETSGTTLEDVDTNVSKNEPKVVQPSSISTGSQTDEPSEATPSKASGAASQNEPKTNDNASQGGWWSSFSWPSWKKGSSGATPQDTDKSNSSDLDGRKMTNLLSKQDNILSNQGSDVFSNPMNSTTPTPSSTSNVAKNAKESSGWGTGLKKWWSELHPIEDLKVWAKEKDAAGVAADIEKELQGLSFESRQKALEKMKFSAQQQLSPEKRKEFDYDSDYIKKWEAQRLLELAAIRVVEKRDQAEWNKRQEEAAEIAEKARDRAIDQSLTADREARLKMVNRDISEQFARKYATEQELRLMTSDEYRAYRKEIDQIEHDNQRFQAQKNVGIDKEIASKTQKLQQEKLRGEAVIKSLKDELAGKESELAQLKTGNAGNKGNNAASNASGGAVVNAPGIVAAQAEIVAIKKNIVAQEQNLNNLVIQTKDLVRKSDIDNLGKKVTDLSSSVDNNKKSLGTLDKKITDLSGSAKDLVHKSDINDLGKKVTELSDSVDSNKKSLDDLGKQFKKVDAMQKSLDDAKKTMKELTGATNSKLTSVVAASTDTKKALETLQTTFAQQSEELKKMQTMFTQELQTVRTSFAETSHALEAEKHNVVSLQKEYNELKQQSSTSSAELIAKKKEVDEAQATYKLLQNDFAAQQAQLAKLQESDAARRAQEEQIAQQKETIAQSLLKFPVSTITGEDIASVLGYGSTSLTDLWKEATRKLTPEELAGLSPQDKAAAIARYEAHQEKMQAALSSYQSEETPTYFSKGLQYVGSTLTNLKEKLLGYVPSSENLKIAGAVVGTAALIGGTSYLAYQQYQKYQNAQQQVQFRQKFYKIYSKADIDLVFYVWPELYGLSEKQCRAILVSMVTVTNTIAILSQTRDETDLEKIRELVRKVITSYHTSDNAAIAQENLKRLNQRIMIQIKPTAVAKK